MFRGVCEGSGGWGGVDLIGGGTWWNLWCGGLGLTLGSGGLCR